MISRSGMNPARIHTLRIFLRSHIISHAGFIPLLDIIQSPPKWAWASPDNRTSTLATRKTDCEEGVTVSTASGSKYRLGYQKGGRSNDKSKSKTKNKKASSSTPKATEEKTKPGRFNFIKSSSSSAPKIKLSGKTIGNGKYLLTGRPRRSTSGKSQIWTAYRSSHSRENSNYSRVTSGLFQGRFVEKYDYFPDT